MNYYINIQSLDASTMCAPQQLGEEREDYDARVEAAKDKAMVSVSALDQEASSTDTACVLNELSPYYFKDNAASEREMIKETMRRVASNIVKREQEKTSALKIITLDGK